MDEDALNMSVRKFLKKVGVTSQREIETAVREAAEQGRLAGVDTIPVSVTLRVDDLGIEHQVDGELKLS